MSKPGIPNKFRLSSEAYSRMKWLRSRVPLADWTIARLGLCMSLGDSHTNDLRKHLGSESEKEFNRYTLTGEFDLMYCELVRSYLEKYCDGSWSEGELFRAHLNRGVIAVSRQIKSLPDLANQLATAAAK